jgi:hypothetical protein
MSAQSVFRYQLISHLMREIGRTAAINVDFEGCSHSNSGWVVNSARSPRELARSEWDGELTETYSPAAVDMAPAMSPARPATSDSEVAAEAAAPPTIRFAVETR